MISASYDIAVDFMDMTADRRLWTRLSDARAGFVPVAGRHVVVGGDDADLAVAKVLSVDAEGRIELEVLRGSVAAHLHLLDLPVRRLLGASPLARASMRPRSTVGVRNGFPVFDVAADAAMFGSDDVERGLDE